MFVPLSGVKSLMYNPEEQSSVEVGLEDAEPCEQPKWYGYDRICGPAYLGLHRLFLYEALHCFLQLQHLEIHSQDNPGRSEGCASVAGFRYAHTIALLGVGEGHWPHTLC